MPRPAAGPSDRASVVLPTVKCSSCGVAIPLSSLGEHVCVPLPALPTLNIIHSGSPRSLNQQLPVVPSPGLQRPNAPNSLHPRGHGGNNNYSFSIGEVVPSSSRLGDYPADVPLSAVSDNSVGRWPIGDSAPVGHVLPSPTLPDTTSGGNAGMAGVGRRAFAAAAWSVRAGVALAANAGKPFHADQSGSPVEPISMPLPIPHPSPPRNTQPRQTPSPVNSTSRHTPSPVPAGGMRINRSPTPREPVILPKVPLAGRERSNTIRDTDRAPSRNDSSRAPSRNDDLRAPSRNDQPLHPGMASRSQSDDTQGGSSFFDRYRQVVGSKSDQGHALNGRIVTSPFGDSDRAAIDRHSLTGSLEDVSMLPWASSPTEPSPGIFEHQRQMTNGSIDSTTSSSASGGPEQLRTGGWAGQEVELVMTPSQSWEGLAGNVNLEPLKTNGYADANAGLGLGDAIPGPLDRIGEEEEDDDDEDGERLVFGVPSTGRNKSSLPRSASEATVTPLSLNSRRQDISMDPPRMGLHSHSKSTDRRMGSSPPQGNGARPKRVCASCGDAVGGPRRFVERDGVVLCEADWKKLYLPSCRRCKNPIEKSAVSSSDGQLKGKWHRACFTCTRCDSPFEGDDFYVHDGRPWCQYHYAEENGTLCASGTCRKPIEGPCILAPASGSGADQRFHPGHLRCEHRGGVSGAQNCREPMNEYYDIGGERYCERHMAEASRRHASGAPQRAEKRRTRLVELGPGQQLRLGA